MASFGRVYQRGSIWWFHYSHRAQLFRESSGSKLKSVAQDKLRDRLGELCDGRAPAARRAAVSFDQLAELLEQDYAINGRKSAADLRYRIEHLRPHFGKLFASEISYDRMTRYIVARKAMGAAPATVQHEVAALSRMLTLAVRSQLIATKPPVPTIKLRNARTGFFEAAEVERVVGHLPASVGAVVRFAYLTGWRRSEILSLEWRCVDSAGVRLEPGTTKNDEGRVYPLTGRLASILADRRAATSLVEKTTCSVVPLVFTWHGGKPIRDFRESWKSAVKAAGVPGRIFHDLRRSAVRNLVRAGVSETVAMKLSGHKTRAIFDRYNIVTDADLIEAAKKAHEG